MKLVPHGIGSIRLGMPPSQVERILGSHHTYEEWMGGNLNGSLLYPGLVISFNRDDGSRPLADSQAIEIWIHPNQPTTLDDQDIFSFYEKDIVSYFNTMGVPYEYVRRDLCVPQYDWIFCFDEEDKRVIAIYLLEQN